jgi:hypothetical protein
MFSDTKLGKNKKATGLASDFFIFSVSVDVSTAMRV